ncbi:MAG: hypothetical protein RIM33_04075 [Alphaproteobacteria bacterium]
MPRFSQDTENTLAEVAVVFGFEHALAYYEQVQDLRKEIQPSPEDSLKRDAIEDQLLARLSRWLQSPPEAGFFITVGYLRHLRNSISHVHSTSSPKFSQFASDNAARLKLFWEGKPAELGQFDFQNTPQQPLTFENAISLSNLNRICVKEIDRLFAESLDQDVVMKTVIQRFWNNRPELRGNHARLSRKARKQILTDFGADLTELTIDTAVNDFLGSTP